MSPAINEAPFMGVSAQVKQADVNSVETNGKPEFSLNVPMLTAEESLAINQISDLLGLARDQKQQLIRQFLEYLLRHGIGQEHDTAAEGLNYLENAFRVNGAPEVVEKMDRLLDQAPALRQLFAVIRQQMEAAERQLEQHRREESELEKRQQDETAAEITSVTQQQLDAWEKWLHQQAIT